MLRIIKTFLSIALFGGALMSQAEADDKVALFETNHGNFVVETYSDKAPITVKNFVSLISDSFYDGLIFHRVIPDFVVQAGGHEADMKPREAPTEIHNESDNGLLNTERTLSMARTSDPHSASSQFFVNLKHNTHLDHRPNQWGYAVFAKVIGGWDVIKSIEVTETSQSVPREPVVINKASMVDREDVTDLLD